MIEDLATAGDLKLDADVLVVGGGTLGLVIAARLAEREVKVVCLESGGWQQDDPVHPLNIIEQKGTPYAGATEGRFRCLGGSSTRWGGALIPFQADDLANTAWPIGSLDLEPWIEQIEALFGLPSGPYEETELLKSKEFVARSAKWPAFGKRNVFSLLRKTIEAPDGPSVWINATATEFDVESGHVTEVRARSQTGGHLRIRANKIILAAGAIESTRLLLLIDKQNGNCLDLDHRKIGTGFCDHLSACVAKVDPTDRTTLNRLVGFRFHGSGMRNVRFELAPSSELRHKISPCFAHVAFTDSGDGFRALRDIFRAIQRRTLFPFATLKRLVADLPWFGRAVWWRYARRRLLYPSGAALELHLVIEQKPRTSNAITLSKTEVDPFGQPLARIEWHVTDEDIGMMERASKAFFEAWPEWPLGTCATLLPRPREDYETELSAEAGIYHPTGSTSMSDDPEFGAVNRDLRVHYLDNLSICATSVLPTGGGANPTMMALLLALRWVDSVAPPQGPTSTDAGLPT